MFRSLFRSRFLFAALALSAIELSSPAARAETTASETARVTQLFKSGKAAFAKGDMAEAERLFSEAFAIRKSADIAANLGQSELEQQKYRSAAEHFQWALVNLLPSATDAQRKAIETGLSRASAEVALLRLDIKPDGSDVLVGERNLGKSPIAGGVYVDPGEVIVSVKHDGYVSMDKRVVAAKGSEQPLEIALSPREEGLTPAAANGPAVDSGLEGNRAPAADVDVPRRQPKSLVPAFVATGVAVAGGVVGLVFTLKANSKESDADDLRNEVGPGGCSGSEAPADTCNELRDRRESVDRSRNLAIGSFVVGGVAAAVAGYFYWDALAHRQRHAARPALTIANIRPSLDLGRGRSEGVAFDSVRLGLSGAF